MTDQFVAPIPADSTPPPAQVQDATKNPATQAAAVQTNSQGNNSFSNMAELKTASPKLYKAMMEGIAMTICNEMQDHQKKLKEMMQKAREDERA